MGGGDLCTVYCTVLCTVPSVYCNFVYFVARHCRVELMWHCDTSHCDKWYIDIWSQSSFSSTNFPSFFISTLNTSLIMHIFVHMIISHLLLSFWARAHRYRSVMLETKIVEVAMNHPVGHVTPITHPVKSIKYSLKTLIMQHFHSTDWTNKALNLFNVQYRFWYNEV